MATTGQDTAPGTLPDGFDAYYTDTIEPELQQVEGQRRNSVRMMLALAAVGALGVISIIVGVATDFGDDRFVLGGDVVLFVAVGVAFWLHYKLRKKII